MANNFLVLGILLLSPLHAAAAVQPDDRLKILKVLAESSRLTVPRDNIACDISGETQAVNGKTVYRRVSVADYLASYTNWTSNKETPQRNAFACTGGNILDCTLQYGLEAGPDHPGFDAFLKFRFDQKKNRVIPESLRCITVP
jgi:hypothetical protein